MHASLHRFLTDRFFARDGVPGVMAQLASLRADEFASIDHLRALQLRRLRALLRHAYDHTRFYRQRFEACGFNVDRVDSIDDLAPLPAVTKHDIRLHHEDMIADNIPRSALHTSRTGGTTGHFLSFTRDNACLPIKEAALFRCELWTGWRFGEWIGMVWPAFIDQPANSGWKPRLRNWLSSRFVALPMVAENAADTRRFAAELTRRRATLIKGFPNALTPVARRIRDEGLAMPPLKGLISTGECLQPQQRRLFAEVFNCPVYDSYRGREGGIIAQQCEQLGGLHINADLVVVQIDDERTMPPVGDGLAYGPILLTDLFNYGMPLIRYEVGDMGALAIDSCACGRNLPLLQGVGGRLADVLYTVDRRPVTPANLVPNLFWYGGKDNQFQLIQKDYERLVLRLTPPELAPEVEAQLRRQAGRIFGLSVQITFEYVDEIPLKSSGKYQLTSCEIPLNNRP